MENTEQKFAANLSRLLSKHNMTQRVLASRVGRSYQHLNEVIKGRATPSLELMEKVAAEFGLEVNEMLGNDLHGAEQVEPYGQEPLTWVPFLEVKEIDGKLKIRTSVSRAPFAFRTDWLHQTGSPDSMVFVRTSGNKLDGELPDNAMVLVDRSQNIVINGAPYLLRVRAELDIKRLVKGQENLTGYDDNLRQKGLAEYRDDEDWEVLGRCVWYSKYLN